jgi:hypothetical protein
MGVVTVTIRTMDDQAVPVEIDGVLVRVFNSSDVFLTSGLTGDTIPGEVDFSLTGDGSGVSYIIRLSKDGVSFPPDPTFDITVTDPPSPPNDFEFTGHVGMVGQLVTISVDTADPAPVPGVTVRVFSSVGVFLSALLTDSSGEADIVLNGLADPGKDYIIRLYKEGYTFPNGAKQLIAVLDPVVPPASNIFDIVAETETLPVSSNPSMCLLSGYLTNISNQPMKNVTLRFAPVMVEPDARVSGFPFPGDPTVMGRSQAFDEVSVTTDDDGYVEVALPREAILNTFHHGYILPQIPGYAQVYIPDVAGAKLEDVLFPYIATVGYDDEAPTLAVGEAQELVLTVIGSNGQEIEGKTPLDALVEFSSSDEEVATVEVTADGTLLVTAVATGSTTITVVRVAGTFAPRVNPAVPAIVVTNPSVTVS